jgi:catechol 2,3-dioxygenase-like lactoylglutathione lyase family enzyme
MDVLMIRNLILCAVFTLPGVASAQDSSKVRPPITGIDHVTLYADDMAKSQQFYQSLLGWEMVPADHAHSGVRFYANHLQYIQLISPPDSRRMNRLDSVAFVTSDAESLRRYLDSRKVVVPRALTIDRDGSKTLLVHDPEGNRIAFVQPGSHPPPEPGTESSRLSSHIIHAGYVVRNRAAMDRFYKDILGFHLYWQGGAKEGDIDWVMMQVPNGTDWIEYMLYLPDRPSREQLGSADHFAPGVVSVAQLQRQLEQRGWKPEQGKNPQVLGVDGKLQLDLTDPAGTRVEFMEFLPVKVPCCSPYTGAQPSPDSNQW